MTGQGVISIFSAIVPERKVRINFTFISSLSLIEYQIGIAFSHAEKFVVSSSMTMGAENGSEYQVN